MRTLHVQTTNRRAARQCATRHEDGLARDETGPQTMPHATDATAMRQQYLFIPARRRARAASSSCTPWRMSVQRQLRRLPRTDNARKRVTEADAKRTGMGTGEESERGGRGEDLEGDQKVEEQADVLVPCCYSSLRCVCAQKRWAEGREGQRGKRSWLLRLLQPPLPVLHSLSHRYSYFSSRASRAFRHQQGLEYTCVAAWQYSGSRGERAARAAPV